MRSKLSSLLFILALSSLPVSGAHASPPFDALGDTTGAGAQQARTVAGGSGAAYFNPSLLIDTPAEVTVGFMILNQRIGIQLDGRPGTQFAVPAGLANAGHADGTRFDNYALPTNDLQFGRMKDARTDGFIARPRQGAGSGHATDTYEVFGLVVKMLSGHIALGMQMLVPNGEFTQMRAFFNDEREQYFSNSLHPELFADRMKALSIGLGVGFKLTDRLSLGAGATFALKANAGASAYVVDAANLGKIQLALNAPVNIGIAPHFGLNYKPTDRLHLTATAHSPQRVEFGSSFTFLLANGIQQASGVTFVLDYTPWQFAAGASYDLVQEPDQTFTLAGTLMYATWSSYTDRHGDKPTPAYAWSDTFSPTFGARYRVGHVSMLLDGSYVPTAVPLQTGRTNYVDNDRITGVAGADYGFKALGTDMKVGAQFQLQRLQPRYQRKLPTPTTPDGKNNNPELVKDEVPDDAQISGNPVASAAGLQTNNPGWPGFSSGGWILAGTVYFSIAL